VTLQNLALLAPIAMVVAVAVIVLVEEWFNRRAMAREQAAAAVPSSAPLTTDINELTIRRITEMLREIEPKRASRER
jgi:hypothetical protein